MAFYSHLRTTLIGSLLFVLAVGYAKATTYIWDASSGAPLNDGGGNWNASGGTNWLNGTNETYGAWGNTDSDVAVFGVGNGSFSGNVYVDNVTVNRIVFNSPGSNIYSIASGTITLDGVTPTITANVDASISSVIAGLNGFTKEGNGKLWLTGMNSSYTGSTTINSGVLRISMIANGGSNSDLGASVNAASNLVLNGGSLQFGYSPLVKMTTDRLFSVGTNGGTLDSSGSAVVIFANKGNMGFNDQLGVRTLTLTGSNSSTFFGVNTLATTISDNGGPTSLIKTGSGLWAITGDNSYTGVTIINGDGILKGTLQIGDGGTSGNLGSGSVINNSILSISRSDSFVLSNEISGTGDLVQSGTGITILTGNNTYSGTTYINKGILQIGNGYTSGTLGKGDVWTSNVMGGAGPWTLAFNRSDDVTITNNMNGSGSITQTGSGTTTLTGSIGVFSGQFDVLNGKLKLGSDFQNGVARANISLRGTLSISRNNFSIGVLAGNGTLENGGTSPTTVNIGDGYTNSLFGGTIQDGGPGKLSLSKSDHTTLTLTGSNTYTGQTTIGGFWPNESSIIRITSLANGGSASGIGAASSAASNLWFTGGILQYVGAATTTDRLFTLSSFRYYVGGIDSSGSGPINFTNTGNIEIDGSGASILSLTGSNTDRNILNPSIKSGFPYGQASIWKTGIGTWVLAGNNSYTGYTKVDAGMLVAGSDNAFGSNSATTVANSAMLRLNGYNIGLGSLSGAGIVENTASGSVTLTLGASYGSNSFGGIIQDGSASGSVSLLKTGAATQILSGVNSYTGTTKVSAGTLQFAKPDSLYGNARANWSSTNLVVNAGSILAFSVGGTGEFNSSDITTLGNLGTATGGFLNGSNLGLDTTNAIGGTFVHVADITDSNQGANSLGLNKLGTGNLLLGGNNTYSGATVVSAGKLIAGSTNAFGSNSKASVASGAILQLNGNDITLGSLAGSGGVENGAATAVMLKVGGSNTDSLFDGHLQNGTGGGALGVTKIGTGTLILSGQNTYSGPTIINEGAISFLFPRTFYNNSTSSWNSDNFIVKAGATAIFNISAPSSGSFTPAHIATIAAQGSNTGGFQSGSTLALDVSNSYYSPTVIIDANITDTNNGLNSIGLNKLGNGNLVLSGHNTYSGPTTVSAGILTITGSINSPVSVSSGAQLIINSTSPFTQNITFSNTGTTGRAVLSGNATVGSSMSLNSLQNTLSPGNSPGSLTFTTNQSWNSFTYDWQTNNFTGTTPGINFDQIVINGSLVLTGGVGSYVLNVLSLTSGNNSGMIPNFSESAHSWDIITTSSGLMGFDPTSWTIDTSGFTAKLSFLPGPDFMGNFSLSQSGNNLSLTYTPVGVPEPSGAILLMIACMWSVSRRNR